MLHFVILLPILCAVPGNSFPQRSNSNFDSNFDFDSYLEHFTEFPLERADNDHSGITRNQDYRYVPFSERPDYIPPILHRGHFPHSNIPRRSVIKQRAWHSSYQDGNYPRPGMDHASNSFRPQNPMQNHGSEWHHPRTNPHLKMQDFGHDAPLVEAFVRKSGHELKRRDHKAPIVDEPSRGKPVFIKEHPENPVLKPIINDDHHDYPDVVETWVRKSKPVVINRAQKQHDSIKNKHENYPEYYEEPVVVEALTKKESSSHNKRHSHKKPILKHEKMPIKKHDQKIQIRTTEIPVSSSRSYYDTPVVVEAFTKEKFPVNSVGHGQKPKEKKPIQPDRKPIATHYPDDYKTPIVVEELIKKESLPSKEDVFKKPIEIPAVKKYVKNPIVEPTYEPVTPSSSDDYDVPIVIEALTKKGTVHNKEQSHKPGMDVEDLYQKNPTEPEKPSYTKDYDVPVVVEAWTKKGTINKEHVHKKPIETDMVVKNYYKNPTEVPDKNYYKNPTEVPDKNYYKNPTEVPDKNYYKNPTEVPDKNYYKNPTEVPDKNYYKNPTEVPDKNYYKNPTEVPDKNYYKNPTEVPDKNYYKNPTEVPDKNYYKNPTEVPDKNYYKNPTEVPDKNYYKNPTEVPDKNYYKNPTEVPDKNYYKNPTEVPDKNYYKNPTEVPDKNYYKNPTEVPDKNYYKNPTEVPDKNYYKNPTEGPIKPSYIKDYEEPVVVEALTKKESSSHNKRHNHKKPILKHEKIPIKKHNQKIQIKTTEIPVSSSRSYYDTPVVVEAFTKGKFPVNSVGHGQKPIATHYPDDYKTPIVVEELIKKESLPSKEHIFKKPIHEIPAVKKYVKNPILEPIYEPVTPSSSDDYDVPIVIEALTKKGTVHNKEQSHKPEMDVEDLYQKNPTEPEKPSYTKDYDVPVVVEAWTEKLTINKEHVHKKPIETDMVVNHYKNPTEVPDKNYYKNPTEVPIKPSYIKDYEEPVVVEALTRKESSSHNKRHNHKKPILKHEKMPIKKHNQKIQIRTTEIPVSSSLSYYDTPVVVEAFTKEKFPVNSVGHGQKPKEKKPILQPDRKPIATHYPDDYKTPVVVEELIKKESLPSKEHIFKKPIHEIPAVKKYVKNPILEPIYEPVTPSSSDDYDVPIVIEALTKKGTVHNKEQSHKPEMDVEDRYQKNPTEEPVRPSYTKDYDAPVVVETWTIEESVHKEKGHKKRVKQGEKMPVWNKHGNEKIIDVEYESEKSEENPSTYGQDDYNKQTTINQFNHKLEDYEYEDSLEVKTPISKGHKMPKEHGHNKVIEKPIKGHLVTKIDNYGKHQMEPIYQENVEGSKIFKDRSEWQSFEGDVNRIKRNVELDIEDYDLPVVEVIKKYPTEVVYSNKPAYVEPLDSSNGYDLPVVVGVKTKNLQALSHKKTILVKPEDREYEYDLPVVIEAQTKNPKSSKEPDSVEPADNGYDYDLPVVVEVYTRQMATSHKKPVLVKPTDREDNYDLPAIDQANYKRNEEYGGKIFKPSKMNKDGEDQETLDVETLTNEKRGTKRHGHNQVENTGTKGKTDVDKKPGQEPIVKIKEMPTRLDPNVEDGYERPIDKQTDVDMDEYEINEHQRPEDYSVTEKNLIHGSFEPMDISDTEVVLDSISINRESPEGREIPVLDVLAVEDQANESNAEIKVMAFNKENGNVNVINIGHEDSNHRIEDFADSGSGVDLDERSVSRSFLPMNSNSWSFMTHIQAQERQKFKRCLTPKNETGNCIPIQMCPIPNSGGTIDDFLRNVCIIDEVFIGICCPEFPVESVRVDWGQFGNANSEPLIDNVKESREPLECGRLPSSIRNEDPWPWMASLVSTTSDRVFCGGALVNEQYVLTAAHCTSRIPRNRILVRLGSPDSQMGSVEFAVVEIKRHAQYNPRTMQNDIALLKLSMRVPLGNFRRLVCIPDKDVEDDVDETVLRWQGRSASGVESLAVISNQECQNRLGTLIGDSVLCTEPRNEETTCNAGSGAPLVVSVGGRFSIIGVLTWNRNDCDERFPSVFTRISSYRRWIQNHSN